MNNRDYREMSPVLLAIPVLAIGLQDSASACISPAIASIAAAFPDTPVSTVQLLATTPSLAVCIVSLFYGWLSLHINPRTICITGLALFVIGGMTPVFLNSFPLIFACRVILGIGAGLTLPACDTIIPALYTGKHRENMMGYNMAAGAVGVTVMVYVGGQMAAIDWHLSFLGYSVGLISFFLVLFLLPKIPMMKDEEGETPKMSVVFRDAKAIAWVEIAVYFVGNLFATMVTANLSLFVENSGIGTPGDTGTALSIMSIGMAVGAFFYGRLKGKLGYFIIPISWLVIALGYGMVWASTGIGSIFIGIFIAGMATGIVWPAYCMRITELVPSYTQPTLIAIAGSLQGFGNFLGPVVGAAIVAMFHVNFGHDLILATVIAVLIITIAVFIAAFIGKARGKTA